MSNGVRVVRGPDWCSGDEDGGEGGVGSAIIEVGKEQDGYVTVKWDSNGEERRYRAGADGKCDLRIFDIAQAGVRHPPVTCDLCREKGIKGFRWKCAKCYDVDLCTKCYMSGEASRGHEYLRFDYSHPDEHCSRMPPRNQEETIARVASGIFDGATVVRGTDWQWQNQDGGAGTGLVLEVKDWKGGFRGGAKVMWEGENEKNSYRVGFGGKQDLLCIEAAKFGTYYPTHLPLLDKQTMVRLSDLGEPVGEPGVDIERAELELGLLLGITTLLRTVLMEDSGRMEAAKKAVPEKAQCKYFKTCCIVLKHIKISEKYFNMKFNNCFCEACMKQRKEKDCYKRGKPPITYALPKGWVKFALQLSMRAEPLDILDNWHLAFHGTSVDKVALIMEHDDLLCPGDRGMHEDRIAEAPGHFDDERKPDGFDTKQVFVSPSMIYAGLKTYAKPFSFTDQDSGRTFRNAQVAFQVRIKPGTYQVGKETVTGKPTPEPSFFDKLLNRSIGIDPHYSNDELEWSTNRRRVIQLTGLMVRVDQ